MQHLLFYGRNPQGGFLEIQENRRPRKGVPLARPYGVRVGGWENNGFHRRAVWRESEWITTVRETDSPDNPVPRIIVMNL